MTTIRPLRVLAILGLATCIGAPLGCGDEDNPPPPPPPGPRAKKPPPKGAAGQKAKRRSRLIAIDKISDELRHGFAESDFQPDPTGELNRDPFRSYLIAQPLSEGEEGEAGDITEVCPPERSIATKYSLRSLNLIGIVLRGTRSYALFRDSARFGHIVRRGDCLGKEKAVVAEIGVGYVSLEVTPEAPQGTAAPPTQKRTIALYPEELSVDAVAPTSQDELDDLPTEALPEDPPPQ